MSSNPKSMSLLTRLQFFANSVISNLSYRSDGTVNRRLLNLADIKVPASPVNPINGITSSDVTVDPSKGLWFRIFVPTAEVIHSLSSLPVIIYFHGGGFVKFSPATKPFDTLCRSLARESPAVVVSVNYRLSPEHKCPAAYDDGFDVLKFIDDEVNRQTIHGFPNNADLGQCFIAGDSAGANIAHHLVARASECEFKQVKVRGLVAVQPFFGGEERTESEVQLRDGTSLTLDRSDFYWKAFLPAGSDRNHPSSNVFGPGSKDISGLDWPPTLVVVGGLDLLQDWQKKYCEGLRGFGKEVELVEYPNVGHGFYSATELQEFSTLVARIVEFLRKQLGSPNPE